VHQPFRGGAQHYGIGRCQSFKASRDVDRFSGGQVLVPSATTHLTHHHWPGMDAKTHRELYPFFLFQARIECRRNGLDNTQTGMQGTLGVVFMRRWPAKVDQQAVSEILGHMAFVLVDDVSGGLLIGADHFTQLFRIELLGEGGRVGEIAEHHGQLPPFGLGSPRRRLEGSVRRIMCGFRVGNGRGRGGDCRRHDRRVFWWRSGREG
jgi:hypothetical protein